MARFMNSEPGTELLDQTMELGNGHTVRVWVGAGDDGAALVFIDTTFEPADKLRVNVNDGGVFGYPDEGERQIREAFIDGYLSDFNDGGGRDKEMAERAWREENVTNTRTGN